MEMGTGSLQRQIGAKQLGIGACACARRPAREVGSAQTRSRTRRTRCCGPPSDSVTAPRTRSSAGLSGRARPSPPNRSPSASMAHVRARRARERRAGQSLPRGTSRARCNSLVRDSAHRDAHPRAQGSPCAPAGCAAGLGSKQSPSGAQGLDGAQSVPPRARHRCLHRRQWAGPRPRRCAGARGACAASAAARIVLVMPSFWSRCLVWIACLG